MEKSINRIIKLLLVIDVMLLVLKIILQISLVLDWGVYVLWGGTSILILFRENIKKAVILISIITLIITGVECYSEKEYKFLSSPNETNHIILESSITSSLHHQYAIIKVYKRRFYIFKQEVGDRIYAYKTRFFLNEGVYSNDGRCFNVDYDLKIIWEGEDNIYLYCDKEQERKDEVLKSNILLKKK